VLGSAEQGRVDPDQRRLVAHAGGTQIGIVAFARFAQIVVPPTNDKDELKRAVRSFTTSLGTAIGSATLASIDAIAQVNSAVAPSGVNLQPDADDAEQDDLPDVSGLEEAYQPDIVVLLTDGANSDGPFPLDAAQQAADRSVRVYTIGFGTADPGQIICTREQLGGDVFSGNFGGNFGGGFGNFGGSIGGGIRRFLVIDEDTLQAMADMTGGAYYRAENADQLLDIFLNLPTQITLQKENRELSVLFSTLGALLATTAVALSLLWNRYP